MSAFLDKTRGYFFRFLDFLFSHKSFRYSSKIFLASLICWYGLKLCGIENPIWSVITVFVVSDPNLHTTYDLARVRVLNTLVGCLFGLISIYLFGYTPLICLLTASFVVLVVNLIERYPVNWRLAPVTVVILMDAGRLAQSPAEELSYVMMRLLEIAVACVVALGLSVLYTKMSRYKEPVKANAEPVAGHETLEL
ncbi:MAG: FUSC family protein [Micavibrio aeruginosavorus]|uniref:FUSC family protein n=1 Tax=Micavibrio aeruginosavorus TaxID=349221 RepID=A0A2W5MQA8_9BACT|nr:MAG: FUSC family protein [Micavibrio aeruginosavorus]